MWHNVLDRKLDIASRLLTIVTSDGQASPVVNRSNRHFCRRPVRAQLIFHTSLTVFFVTFFLLLQRTILDAWDTHTSDTAQTHPLDSRSTVTGILPMILAVDTNSAALFFLYIDKSKPPSNDRAMYPQNSVWLKKKKNIHSIYSNPDHVRHCNICVVFISPSPCSRKHQKERV